MARVTNSNNRPTTGYSPENEQKYKDAYAGKIALTKEDAEGMYREAPRRTAHLFNSIKSGWSIHFRLNEDVAGKTAQNPESIPLLVSADPQLAGLGLGLKMFVADHKKGPKENCQLTFNNLFEVLEAGAKKGSATAEYYTYERNRLHYAAKVVDPFLEKGVDRSLDMRPDAIFTKFADIQDKHNFPVSSHVKFRILYDAALKMNPLGKGEKESDKPLEKKVDPKSQDMKAFFNMDTYRGLSGQQTLLIMEAACRHRWSADDRGKVNYGRQITKILDDQIHLGSYPKNSSYISALVSLRAGIYSDYEPQKAPDMLIYKVRALVTGFSPSQDINSARLRQQAEAIMNDPKYDNDGAWNELQTEVAEAGREYRFYQQDKGLLVDSIRQGYDSVESMRLASYSGSETAPTYPRGGYVSHPYEREEGAPVPEQSKRAQKIDQPPRMGPSTEQLLALQKAEAKQAETGDYSQKTSNSKSVAKEVSKSDTKSKPAESEVVKPKLVGTLFEQGISKFGNKQADDDVAVTMIAAHYGLKVDKARKSLTSDQENKIKALGENANITDVKKVLGECKVQLSKHKLTDADIAKLPTLATAKTPNAETQL